MCSVKIAWKSWSECAELSYTLPAVLKWDYYLELRDGTSGQCIWKGICYPCCQLSCRLNWNQWNPKCGKKWSPATKSLPKNWVSSWPTKSNTYKCSRYNSERTVKKSCSHQWEPYYYNSGSLGFDCLQTHNCVDVQADGGGGTGKKKSYHSCMQLLLLTITYFGSYISFHAHLYPHLLPQWVLPFSSVKKTCSTVKVGFWPTFKCVYTKLKVPRRCPT